MTRAGSLLLALLGLVVAGCGATNDAVVFRREMPNQVLAAPRGPDDQTFRVAWGEVPGASAYRVSVSLTSSMEGAARYSFENATEAAIPQAEPAHQQSWITVEALVGNAHSEPTLPLEVATASTGGALWVSAGMPANLPYIAPVWRPSGAAFHDATPAPPYVCRWYFTGNEPTEIVLSPCDPATVGNLSHEFPAYQFDWRIRLTVVANDGRTASAMTTAHAE